MDEIDHTIPSNEILEIIASSLQRNASSQELEKLEIWLQMEPENKATYEEMSALWHVVGFESKKDQYNPEVAWNRILPDTLQVSMEEKVPSSGFRWWAVAAAIVLLASLFYLYRSFQPVSYSKPEMVHHINVHVPFGSRSQINLPDGSMVWINAGTSLHFPEDFNQGHREVWLEGEAYFDVQCKKGMEFLVHTHTETISVIGTAFNVKAYPDEHYVITTVERGRVLITQNHGTGKEGRVLLEKNQRATCLVELLNSSKIGTDSIKSSPLIINELKSTKIETSWKDERWIIEHEELSSLAIKLHRRYDVEIDFESESLKHLIFSGIIENESITQVLKIMSLTAPVSFKIDNKHILLIKNKQ